MGLLVLGCQLLSLWLVVADPVDRHIDFTGKKYKGLTCAVASFENPSESYLLHMGPRAWIHCVDDDGEVEYTRPVYVKTVYDAPTAGRCDPPAPPAPTARTYTRPDTVWEDPEDEWDYEDDLAQ
jgi:hypothetical protein